MSEFKVCKKCGISKPTIDFNRSSRTRDGLNDWCKTCTRVACREWKKANPEKIKAYGKIYYKSHKEQQQAYREKNLEKIIAYQKNYKKKNGKYLREMDRLRKQKIRAKAARYAAKIEPQQLNPEDVNNNAQMRLIDA